MIELVNLIEEISTIVPKLWLVAFFFTIILLFQIVLFAARPGNKDRGRFIIILLAAIAYNFIIGYVAKNDISVGFTMQVLITYSFSILIAFYFCFYTYKLLQNKELFGVLILAPAFILASSYLISFLPSFLINKDEVLAGKLLVIVPCCYAVFVLIKLLQIVKKKLAEYNNVKNFNLKIALGIMGIATFLCLAVIQFFENEAIEILIINFGFTGMLLISLAIDFINYKKEGLRLPFLESSVPNLKEELDRRVFNSTWEIEAEKREIRNNFMKLAHEVRTPVTLINCYLDEYILKNKENGEIGIIKENIEKLDKSIDNFLNADNIGKKQIELDNKLITDFSSSLNSALLLFKQYASNKNIKIISDIEENIFVKAAPEAIGIIINNLLDNAIKYLPNSGIIHTKLSTNNDKIYFSVKDNGEGIPQDKQLDIFKPLVQISTKKSEKRGAGMGLSTLNTIVDKLDGSIKVTSEEGIGSEFVVELKVYKIINGEEVKSYKPDITREVKCMDSITGKKNSILIVEDDPALLQLLHKKLAPYYNIYLAKNGIDALSKLACIEEIPDIIISDIIMDEMDGFELIKTLKENPTYSLIPIVFITAKTSVDDRVKGLKSGAYDYISKPFNIREIKAKIEAILKNTDIQKESFFENIYRTAISKMENAPVCSTSQDVFNNNCKKYKLSDSELRVIKVVMTDQGLSNQEVGDKIGISKRTVEKHLQNMYVKTGVKSKIDLLRKLLFKEE